MMKIISDEKTFVLPLNDMRNKTVLIPNENNELFIQCLQSYFSNKKKNKCLICDDDDLPINMDEVNFIYLPKDTSYLSNVEMKPKSIINNEILHFIETNPQAFQTVESIRNLIENLESDEGMFKLSRIVSKGLDGQFFIKLNDFRCQSILEMFRIDADEVQDSIKQLIILNIILFPLSDKPNIIYVDRDIDKNIILWSNCLRENDYLLIDNESLKETIDGFDLLKISDNSQIQFSEESNENVKILSYMNHNLIKTNLALQSEKNIKIFEDYNSNFTSFLIKNACYDVAISL